MMKRTMEVLSARHRLRRMLFAASILSASVAWGRAALAQEVSSLTAGARVRVTRLSTGMDEGRFVALTPDSLTFAARDGSRRAVALQDMALLELADGFRTRAQEFAIGGALGGAVIGGALGALAVRRQNAAPREFPQLASADAGGLAGALVGAVGGGVAGALVGRYLKTDRWKSVRWDAGRL